MAEKKPRKKGKNRQKRDILTGEAVPKDAITLTILRQVQEELKANGTEMTIDEIRKIASSQFEYAAFVIKTGEKLEGEGIRIPHFGRFSIKKGRLRVKQLLDEGIPRKEVNKIIKQEAYLNNGIDVTSD